MIGDFHIHTCASDGTNTPLEVLERVKAAHLDAFAITDHDTLKGSLSLRPYLKEDDPVMITGIELSTICKDENVHILGYFSNQCDLTDLEKRCEDMERARRERAFSINRLLKEHFNKEFDVEEVLAHTMVTRGSIAQSLLRHYPELTLDDIFKKMLGEGCPAYLPATHMAPREAIDGIHKVGGYAVLAHPILLKKNNPEDLIQLGMDGIEAIYPLNRKDDDHLFKAMAKRYHLFYTAGSDYHGFNDGKHGNVGSVTLANQPLERFLALFK